MLASYPVKKTLHALGCLLPNPPFFCDYPWLLNLSIGGCTHCRMLASQIVTVTSLLPSFESPLWILLSLDTETFQKTVTGF